MLPSRVPFIFLLGLLILHSSCDPIKVGPDPKPVAEIDKLPPATQSGKNTFGCLVNGKAWINMNSLDAYGSSIFSNQLSIRSENKSNDLFIYIDLKNDDIVSRSYNISTDSLNFYFDDTPPLCSYPYEYITSGKLVISRLDRVNSIVSGTFEFVAEKTDCNKITVTDGRFDLTLFQ